MSLPVQDHPKFLTLLGGTNQEIGDSNTSKGTGDEDPYGETGNGVTDAETKTSVIKKKNFQSCTSVGLSR